MNIPRLPTLLVSIALFTASHLGAQQFDLLPTLPESFVTARIAVEPAQVEENLELPPNVREPVDVRDRFAGLVEFPEGASLTYVPAKRQLIHVNTRANIEAFSRIIEPRQPAAQVEVEVSMRRRGPGKDGKMSTSEVQALHVMTLSGVTAEAEEQKKANGIVIQHTQLQVTPTVGPDGAVSCDIQWTGRAPGRTPSSNVLYELVLSNRVTCVDGKPVLVHERLLPGNVVETLVAEANLVDDRGMPIRELPPSIVVDEPDAEDALGNLETWRIGIPRACDGAELVEGVMRSVQAGDGAELRYDAINNEILSVNDPLSQRKILSLLAQACEAPASPKLTLEVVRIPADGRVDPLDRKAEGRRVAQSYSVPATSGVTVEQTSSQITTASGDRSAMQVSLFPLVDSDRSKTHVTLKLHGVIESGGEPSSEMRVNASVVVRDGAPAVVHRRKVGGNEFEVLIVTCDLVDHEGRPVRKFPYGFPIERD